MKVGDIVIHYPPSIYFDGELYKNAARKTKLVEIIDKVDGESFMVRENAGAELEMVWGGWLEEIDYDPAA